MLFVLAFAAFLLLLLPRVCAARLPQLRTYRIACDPDQLGQIYESPHETIYIACELVYQGQVWHNARLRLRGDSSRDYPKKSYQVNFDADERFYGRDRINLISEWRDASYCREFLSYDTFLRAGLDASRTWFARVYINDVYMGLYLDVEQVDEHLLARSALDDSSSVYKAEFDDAMLLEGERVDSLWTKETNKTTGFYDLSDLIEWINNVPDESFFAELDEKFDREQLARHLAVNTLITNSSTYYHNYFLVHDLHPGGRWRILPWDMDRSYRAYYGYSSPNYFVCSHPTKQEVNELIRRCWRDANMRDLIFANVTGIIDSLMVQSYYDSLVANLDTLLQVAVEQDTYKQYTTQEFHDALGAIPNYVEGRANYMRHSIKSSPYPFSLLEETREIHGIRLRWESSVTADGGPVTYRVLLDTLYDLPDPEIFDVGSDTTLLLNTLAARRWYWRAEALNTSGDNTPSIQFFNSFDLPRPLGTSQELPDTLTNDRTVSPEGGPLWLRRTVLVPEGVTLTVEAGTHLGIADSASLIIEGKFRANGTKEQPVTITSLRNGESGGTIERHETSEEVTIVHTLIDNLGGIVSGKLNVSDGGVLTLAESSITNFPDVAVLAESGYTRLQGAQVRCSGEKGIWIRGGSLTVTNSQLIDMGNDTTNSLIFCDAKTEDIEIVDSQLRTFGAHSLRAELNGASMTLYDVEFNGGGLVLDGPLQIETYNSSWFDCDTALAIGPEVSVTCYNGLFSRNGIALVQNEGVNTSAQLPYIRNAVFYANQENLSPYGSTHWDLGFSYLSSADSLGWERILSGDLGVIDPWNGNWQLEPGSQLIDAGWGTGAAALDVVRQRRVDVPSVTNTGQGEISYVDIGLYEYPYGIVPFLPESDSLSALFVYPNPTGGRVMLSFLMKSAGGARLTIFNLLGQRVYQQQLSGLAPGRHRIIWACKNTAGTPVASGFYIAHLLLPEGTRDARIILLR